MSKTNEAGCPSGAHVSGGFCMCDRHYYARNPWAKGTMAKPLPVGTRPATPAETGHALGLIGPAQIDNMVLLVTK